MQSMPVRSMERLIHAPLQPTPQAEAALLTEALTAAHRQLQILGQSWEAQKQHYREKQRAFEALDLARPHSPKATETI
jgi:hypothetical protein